MPKTQTSNTQETSEEVSISLHTFAHANAKKYGIELMGGFYHAMETAKPPHLVDTQSGWEAAMKEFQGKEVK